MTGNRSFCDDSGTDMMTSKCLRIDFWKFQLGIANEAR